MERTLIDYANISFLKIPTTTKNRDARGDTDIIPNHYVLYARRNVIKAADGAVTTNHYIPALSLNDGEWLHHCAVTKGDLACKLHSGLSTDQASTGEKIIGRDDPMWDEIPFDDAGEWILHGVLFLVYGLTAVIENLYAKRFAMASGSRL
jgi:hypothetical protein